MRKILALLTLAFLFNNLLFAQINMTKIGELGYQEDLSDVWGWVDTAGTEYALVGVYDGFSVVSLEDPTNPTEVFFEGGASTIWRDMKTWNNHAYVTNEGGGGLLIADLSSLPSNPNLTTTTYNGVIYPFQTAHNLYIDENGIAYIFGADNGEGGAIMLDLNQNPMQPVELGIFDDYYIHDGVTRGDTLWASHINDGFQSVIDVSNKSNPIMLSNWNTPNNFSHNCWFSDDNNYLFTTDEKQFAYIGAYDVSDLGNVVETDRWQSNPGSGTIPHNVHFMDNYTITSYYADGISVLDVSNPHNLVEVGNYDTSPNYAGNDAGGFHGSWGAYPWLPSGNILATDIEEGLVVLGINYQRACQLTGVVSDSTCGDVLNDVVVEITSENLSESTDIQGEYAFGTPNSGTYSVTFSKSGYQSKTVNNVSLVNGQITNLDVNLYSSSTVAITGTVNGIGAGALANAQVAISNPVESYNFITDNSGSFDKCNVVAGTYDVVVSKWGYKTACYSNVVINSGASNLTYGLEVGYYDDFATDLGWTRTGTASAGKWERGDPVGTFDNNSNPSNPENDAIDTDCDNSAYVTGNGGGNYYDDDIDNGNTIITSPMMDLSQMNEPHIKFSSWFFTTAGSGPPYNDYFTVEITNGTQTVELLREDTNSVMGQWNTHDIDITGLLTLSPFMQVVVAATDDDPGHIVEAGLDLFEVVDATPSSITESKEQYLGVYPNPTNSTVSFEVTENGSYTLINIVGEVVRTGRVVAGQNTLNLSSLSNGVYQIVITSKGNTQNQKITKY